MRGTPSHESEKYEPPLGGRQNLRKPMPRDTRYKGESYPAHDIKSRYEEHMRKQRETDDDGSRVQPPRPALHRLVGAAE